MKRRDVLATTGAALSAALVGIASNTRMAAAKPVENPWARVRRLSVELSHALADEDVGGFYAEVHPATDRPRPVAFIATDTTDRVKEAIRAHKAAYDRFVNAEEGRFSERKMTRLWLEASRAFDALLATPCPSLPAAQLKAFYLANARPDMAGVDCWSADEVAALLRSLYVGT
jgi:hypothetical protein